MTVAVVGMGAVGTALAGALAEAGHRILACGSKPLERIEIIDHDGTRQYPVRWLASAEQAEPVEWVVLATKMHQTASAEPWLRALTSRHTRVVAAQNGVDHVDRVGPLVAGAVVPALVYINAERTGPGQVRARHTDRDLVVPGDDDGRATAELFATSGLRVEADPDFRTAAWLKLLTNVVANPITALTGRRVEVLREPEVATLAEKLLRETVAVGRAEGASLTEQDADKALSWLRGIAPDSTSSMLQDRKAGRTLEYDGLTGAVVRLGDKHGLPVEANRALLALLSAL
ncbi:2-dehydropantoate 2-reductase [Amycolatopsis sp. K13G38]|uniref:2-dehydropantoate 2-reductase n=1 Tax=Amycolatopsis acididurans TaxID=2724524 RepID=A0ABX1J7R8_9PSEU|nr:2-dehydropantoate 2-reductase [Amycolatopsis acididurans]NKQ55848.1 2-dehydropantoate 2-reductase [Amycolatopsis acididurans]